MSDQSFRSFLRDLEARGELLRFAKPVHPERNMAAVGQIVADRRQGR